MKKELMKPLSNTIFLGIYSKCEQDPELEKSLRGLINAILLERKHNKKTLIKKINKVQIECTDLGNNDKARGIRIDLLVTAMDNSIFSLEIQLAWDANMVSRNLYYLSRHIGSQLKKGDEYKKLNQISMINILNFNMFDNEKYPEFYKTAAIMLEGYQDSIVSDEVIFYFIELPKFKKAERDYSNPLHSWLTYFIKGYGDENMKAELIGKNSDIKAFDEAFNMMQDDEDIRVQYEFERRSREAYLSGMQSAEEKGWKKGIEEGEKLTIKIIKLLGKGYIASDIARELDIPEKNVENVILKYNEE